MALEKLPPDLEATMIWQPFLRCSPAWQRVKYSLVKLAFMKPAPSLSSVLIFSFSSASIGVLQSPLRSCFEVQKSVKSCPVISSFSPPVEPLRAEVKMISL